MNLMLHDSKESKQNVLARRNRTKYSEQAEQDMDKNKWEQYHDRAVRSHTITGWCYLQFLSPGMFQNGNHTPSHSCQIIEVNGLLMPSCLHHALEGVQRYVWI